MSYRIGDFLVYGELYNDRNNSTHGLLALRGEQEGRETILRLELTGNCDEDLRGKRVRFQPEERSTRGPVFRLDEHPGLQLRQIGPTGTMTAAGWVHTFEGSIEEFLQRAELGEPAPTQWQRRLYLEWFSQNGRMLVELGGVNVEVQVTPPDGSDEVWEPLPNPAAHPELTGACKEQDAISSEGGVSLPRATPAGGEAVIEQWRPVREELAREEEHFEILPQDLQYVMDAEAAAIDHAIACDDEADADARLEDDEEEEDEFEAFKRVEHCIENGISIPLAEVVGDPASLPPPEALTDTDAEHWLKLLLGQLALRGVSLDVCEHYSTLDAYRYLVEHVLPEAGYVPEASGSGWVQHFSTWEQCPICDAEAEAQWEAHMRGEDLPF